jgi:hypothetical protein
LKGCAFYRCGYPDTWIWQEKTHKKSKRLAHYSHFRASLTTFLGISLVYTSLCSIHILYYIPAEALCKRIYHPPFRWDLEKGICPWLGHSIWLC